LSIEPNFISFSILSLSGQKSIGRGENYSKPSIGAKLTGGDRSRLITTVKHRDQAPPRDIMLTFTIYEPITEIKF